MNTLVGCGGRSELCQPDGGWRSTLGGEGGRSIPVVGGRSTAAWRSTPSGARRTAPANKESPFGPVYSGVAHFP